MRVSAGVFGDQWATSIAAGAVGHLLLGCWITVALVLDVGCSQHLQVGV